jgi:flagellar motor switch protein FliG
MEEMDKEAMKRELSPWQKIAVLMVALGNELAATLMRGLSDEEAEELTRALTELKKVPTDLQDRVLADFAAGLDGDDEGISGGMDFARQLLERAVGERRAREVMKRAVGGPSSGFALLRAADPVQVAPFIAREHPQTIALILSQLAAEHAAALLENFPRDIQVEVAHRIATLGKVDPEVLREVEESLVSLLEGALGQQRQVGGSEKAAAILNAAGNRLEKGVLDRIDREDPEVADAIRRRLFVFDDLARLREEDVQKMLLQIDMDDLRLALKSAGKAVRDLFLSAMSERRRLSFFEEMEAMPPVRLSEVRDAQDRIVQYVRQLEEQHVLKIPRSDEDDPYV